MKSIFDFNILTHMYHINWELYKIEFNTETKSLSASTHTLLDLQDLTRTCKKMNISSTDYLRFRSLDKIRVPIILYKSERMFEL